MAENTIPTIPLSNSLQFIRYEDRNDLQTDFNRIYGEYTYFNRYCIDYYQKYKQDSDLWVQFRSTYTIHEAYIIDSELNKIELTISTDNVYDDYTYYTIEVDTSALNGYYYVSLITDKDSDKIVNTFNSNYFEVRESYDNVLKIEWNGNLAIDDGMDWGSRTQEMYINGQILDSISASDVVTHRDDNGNLIVLNASKYYKKKLQIELIPDFMIHLMDLAIKHDYFFINGQLWVAEGSFEFGDILGYSQMYTPEVELELTDYENYTSDRIASGYLPTISDTSLAFDDTTSLAFDDTTSLAFNG